ncbi:MAG: right-handed parallel beta-helix repeat-containing protein, partial [Candidatus Eisenbacteria sp.]|nr:right-handed parallel beta-helix repeat-containing protein [Candidatus Eisenbacteria bacterium]
MDDGWAGLNPGDPADGHIFGTDAFATIQDGIDGVATDGTVHVAAGTYNEQVFISKANLTVESIAGATITIIDGTGVTDAALIPGHSALVWLQKNGITFKGFTVQGYPGSWGDGGGIFIQGYNGTTVDDISGCLVTENTINVSTSGIDGIIISGGADNNTVSDNEISNSGGDGIIVSSDPDSVGNQITANTITDSTNYGVSLCTATWGTQRNFQGTVISDNGISGGTHGIGVIYAIGSSHIVIQDNYIHGVTTGEGEGIEIYNGAYVDVLGNILEGNGTGIQVKESDCTGIVANYNNISGNTTYGVEAVSITSGPLDATLNWWGDASGPYHPTTNPGGTGDEVSDNVGYSPWLGAPLVLPGVQYESLGAGTNQVVDATAEADTIVTLTTTGNTDIYIARYQSQPFPEEPFPDEALGKYIDIHVSNPENVVWPIFVEVHYTDGEVRAAGIAEGSLGLYYYMSPD